VVWPFSGFLWEAFGLNKNGDMEAMSPLVCHDELADWNAVFLLFIAEILFL